MMYANMHGIPSAFVRADAKHAGMLIKKVELKFIRYNDAFIIITDWTVITLYQGLAIDVADAGMIVS